MPDIGSIPGVSAAEAASLAGLGLHTGADLLRTDRAELVRRLPALTLERVRGWQGFAALCEVRDMTEADAARLSGAGFGGIDELAGARLARLRAALPGTPDETILDWVRDAVRLAHTGVLNGNVRLADGSPVDGATVVAGGVAAVSDPRGRFRILRLPLDRKVVVTVHHPTLGYRLSRGVPVAPAAALVGQTFILAGRPQAPRMLSQRRGDQLPPLGSAPITTRVETARPEPDDILMVIDRHAGGDARAASRFLDFDAGRFVRRVYRIPAAALPAGLRDGDDIEWTGTVWALARYSAQEIARMVRFRRATRSLPKATLPEARRRRAMAAIVKAFPDP